MITPTRIAELRRLAEAASKAPWTMCVLSANSMYEQAIKVVFMILNADEPRPCFFIRNDEKLTVAATMNGPTSEANMQFIHASRTALPEALDEIERLRGVLQQLADNGYSCGWDHCEAQVIAQAALAESAPC